MPIDVKNPLTDPYPLEVPLPSAPLIRVLARVDFPLISSIHNLDFIGPFQEQIRAEYPVLEPQQVPQVSVTAGQPPQLQMAVMWRFCSRKRDWVVVLANNAIIVETTNYHSRADFVDRVRRVCLAAERALKPGLVTRLGVRYIDRLDAGHTARVADLIRPSLIGILAERDSPQPQLAAGELVFAMPIEHGQLRARWASLPAGATLDANSAPPIPEASWVLDLDASDTAQTEFVAAEVAGKVMVFASRIYTVFRWAVTRQFLTEFGGLQ